MKKHNIDVTKIIVENAGHGSDHWCQPEIENIIVDFLREKLNI